MYCSKCGSLVNDALKYCKSCGVRLLEDDDKDTHGSILDNLLTTLCFIVLGGLGILIGLIAVLLDKSVSHEAVALIAITYIVGLFGICFMILSPVPKLITAKLNKESERGETISFVQLPAKNTAQLEEHRESVLSVTENTTRTLEKVAIEQS